MSPRGNVSEYISKYAEVAKPLLEADAYPEQLTVPGKQGFWCSVFRKISWCLGIWGNLVAFLAIVVFLQRLLCQHSLNLWDQQLRPEFAHEPLAKKTIRYFDGYLIAKAGVDGPADFQANVARALAPDVVMESVGWGPGSDTLFTYGRDAWQSSGEEQQFRKAFGSTELFTQMMFFGDNDTATTTSYGTLFWGGELFGIPAPRMWVELRVCDFYRVIKDPKGIYGGLISYNFQMIDWPDVMHRAGYSVLPPAQLEDGFVLPPAANDGVPAPYSVLVRKQDAEVSRKIAKSMLQEFWCGKADADRWWHSTLTFYGPRGIGVARSQQELRTNILEPFRMAFANRTLELELLTSEGNYVAALGSISGNHIGTWLGLTPSRKRLSVRFGMHWRLVDGKAKEGWAIFDVPGLYRQLGLDFFKTALDGNLRRQPVKLEGATHKHTVEIPTQAMSTEMQADGFLKHQ